MRLRLRIQLASLTWYIIGPLLDRTIPPLLDASMPSITFLQHHMTMPPLLGTSMLSYSSSLTVHHAMNAIGLPYLVHQYYHRSVRLHLRIQLASLTWYMNAIIQFITYLDHCFGGAGAVANRTIGPLLGRTIPPLLDTSMPSITFLQHHMTIPPLLGTSMLSYSSSLTVHHVMNAIGLPYLVHQYYHRSVRLQIQLASLTWYINAIIQFITYSSWLTESG